MNELLFPHLLFFYGTVFVATNPMYP